MNSEWWTVKRTGKNEYTHFIDQRFNTSQLAMDFMINQRNNRDVKTITVERTEVVYNESFN